PSRRWTRSGDQTSAAEATVLTSPRVADTGGLRCTGRSPRSIRDGHTSQRVRRQVAALDRGRGRFRDGAPRQLEDRRRRPEQLADGREGLDGAQVTLLRTALTPLGFDPLGQRGFVAV